MQRNWIGKSVGAEINFNIVGKNVKEEKIKIYTTRPDTLYGATFIAISAQHTLAKNLSENNNDIKKFIKESERSNPDKEKLGLNTGIIVEHPITKKTPARIYS